MRLAEYIQNNHEAILAEWETFARTLLPAAAGMSAAGLRDHADEILSAIVRDMESSESPAETMAKSKGEESGEHARGGGADPLGTIGQIHALIRIESGFTLSQVVAEYRALRASVFRLWRKHLADDADGALRFNEAIDEALAEAVARYAEKTNQYRDQLIAIVSHDLRNPLGGILMGSAILTSVEGLDDRNARIASRIQNSAKRMVRIVGDLLDLTRTRLGSKIPIVRGVMNLGPTCELVIAELSGAHPNAVLRFTSQGDLRGVWDSDRLAQVLSNLVGNAIQHGDKTKPITIAANGEWSRVVLSVHNEGAPIPEDEQGEIFEPMVRQQGAERMSTGLGLGLFIANELVAAHDGHLSVTSTVANGTTFTVDLPRHPLAETESSRAPLSVSATEGVRRARDPSPSHRALADAATSSDVADGGGDASSSSSHFSSATKFTGLTR